MRKSISFCLLLSMLVLGITLIPVSSAQDDKAGKSDKSDKKDKDGKKKKDDATPSREDRAVLWRDPGNIESLDLFGGPGGVQGAPDPKARYTFLSRSESGTSEKINVEDDKKREWQVKFGAEARPAPAASRIVWAAGYHVDTDYFVKRTHVEGRGGFDVWDVRFKPKDDFKEEDVWKWDANPFMGTRELDGLKTLMALISNWDMKTNNNKVLRAKKGTGKNENELIYYVSDLGATFGKTGFIVREVPGLQNMRGGSKGDPIAYANQPFILGVENGTVIFNYKGKEKEHLKGIKVEHARWMGELLGRLSDKQLADAFRASDYPADEIQIFVKALRARIDQLKNLK
jgi:hypothetical protein